MSNEAINPLKEERDSELNDNEESTMRLKQNDDSKIVRNIDNESETGTVSDNDSTVRINFDDDSTVRINSDDDATVRVNTNDDSTVRINDSDDLAVDSDFSQNIIVLNGVEYQIERTISESTGEARIELLKRNNELSVLKLYFSSVKPKLELVNKLKDLVHQNIIKIFEYGFYNSDSGEQRFFERMEYAHGGTAEEFMAIKDVAFIRRIIANVTEGLDYIHKKGIIHRDIKPGNLFFRDKEQTELIISDFGISSLKNTEDDIHQTVNKAFTKFYSAPETLTIEDKITIEPKLDFYSLGLSILRLWHGKNLYKGIPDHIITTMKFDNKLLDPNLIDDAFPRELLSLVRGLTLVSRENRWGASEVRKWLNGELVDIVNDVTDIDPRRPFEFDKQEGLIANNTKELAQMLLSHKELGIKYLYRGKISDWLKESDPKTQTLIDDIVEDQYKDDKNAGLQATVYLLDQDFPYYDINGKACADHVEISYTLENNRKEYYRRLQNKSDNFYIYWRSQNNAKFAEYCYSLINDSKTPAELAILKIVYSINPDFPFPLGQGGEKHFVNFPNELVPYVKENGNLNIIKALEDGSLLVWFESLEECNELSKAVRNAQANSFSSEWIISIISYYVDEGAGYYGYEKAPAKVYSKEELALHLVDYAEVYSQLLKKGENIPVFDYMIARGWDKHLELFKKVRQATGYDCAPLTDDLRFAIIARDLDPNVPYVFQNGIAVTSIEELRDKFTDVKNKVAILLNNDDAKFCAWLQAQFHYKLDYKHSNTAEFYKRLKEYFELRAQLFPKDKKIKRYQKAFERLEKIYIKIQRLNKIKLIFLIIGVLASSFSLYKLTYWLKETKLPPDLDVHDYLPPGIIPLYIALIIIFLIVNFVIFFKGVKLSNKVAPNLKNGENKTEKLALLYAAEKGRNPIKKFQDKIVLNYYKDRIKRIVAQSIIIFLTLFLTYHCWTLIPFPNKSYMENKNNEQLNNTEALFSPMLNRLYIGYFGSDFMELDFRKIEKNILQVSVQTENQRQKFLGYYDDKAGKIKLSPESLALEGEFTLEVSKDFNELAVYMDKSILDYYEFESTERVIPFKSTLFHQNNWVANTSIFGKKCVIKLNNDKSASIAFPTNLTEKYRSAYKYTRERIVRIKRESGKELYLVSFFLYDDDLKNNKELNSEVLNNSQLRSHFEIMSELLSYSLIRFDLTLSDDGENYKGVYHLFQPGTDNTMYHTTPVTFKQVN